MDLPPLLGTGREVEVVGCGGVEVRRRRGGGEEVV
jgi:hypothetical protein